MHPTPAMVKAGGMLPAPAGPKPTQPAGASPLLYLAPNHPYLLSEVEYAVQREGAQVRSPHLLHAASATPPPDTLTLTRLRLHSTSAAH